MVEPLRFVTYLAPSLPLELFGAVARAVGAALGRPVRVRAETRRSGPTGPADDSLTAGSEDVAFLCPPTYLWLMRRAPGAVALVPAAPVFRDPRCAGRPIYFADLIVPAASTARRFEDLRGGVWAYNDVASLSGYHCLLDRLATLGHDRRFFRALRRSGSHLRSLGLVAAGLADAAAIDSNALALASRRDSVLTSRVRVVERWGPFPVQPLVARAALPKDVRTALAAALLAIGVDPVARRALDSFGVEGFAPVSDADYRNHPALRRARTQRVPAPLLPIGDR